jgi:hypothetical protein
LRTRPDFIIAGAPRTGTTWLTVAAERHPKIRLAQPLQPEPKFFLVDDLYREGLESYRQKYFADVPEDCVCGEKTTNYLESPTAAERMAAHLPQVKLIFVLRDPVERAISNYWWSRQNGLETEAIETAFALEEEREARYIDKDHYSRPYSYFSRGLYAALLQPWLARFPREQILFLKHENIKTRARELLQSFHRFIGVDERPEDAENLGVVRASQKDGPVSDEFKRRLHERYRQPNARLAELLGPEFQW